MYVLRFELTIGDLWVHKLFVFKNPQTLVLPNVQDIDSYTPSMRIYISLLYLWIFFFMEFLTGIPHIFGWKSGSISQGFTDLNYDPVTPTVNPLLIMEWNITIYPLSDECHLLTTSNRILGLYVIGISVWAWILVKSSLSFNDVLTQMHITPVLTLAGCCTFCKLKLTQLVAPWVTRPEINSSKLLNILYILYCIW